MVRLKTRYLVCQILHNHAVGSGVPSGGGGGYRIGAGDLTSALKEKLQTLYGDVGLGAMLSSCKVKLIDAERGIFMVRTSRTHFREVQFALSCVITAKGIHVTLRCLQVASTSRSCVGSLRRLIDTDGTKFVPISVV